MTEPKHNEDTFKSAAAAIFCAVAVFTLGTCLSEESRTSEKRYETCMNVEKSVEKCGKP